jgi:predicted DNA-binding transcriptional regulator YafY
MEFCVSRPTARVLALLELLQDGGQHTVGALAGRLGVDERTVRRYAEHLADLDIPVRSRRGRYGGYQLARGYKLPPLMLNDDEAIAVVLGLAAGRRSGLLTTEVAAADSAMAKVSRVLPRGLASRLASLLSTAQFTGASRPGAPTGAPVLLELAEAAEQRRTATIDYTTWDGRTSQRALDPYGLVFHSGRWYVTGHDHSRGEIRTFRLDRIARARAGEGTYEVPADFDPPGHVLAGIAAVGWRHEVAVVLHTTLDEARRRLPPTVGALAEHPDGVALTARAERLDRMAQLLAGLGWSFTIDRPEALRAEVAALADRLRGAAVSPPARGPGRPGRQRSG